jgi:hypothetical protein
MLVQGRGAHRWALLVVTLGLSSTTAAESIVPTLAIPATAALALPSPLGGAAAHALVDAASDVPAGEEPPLEAGARTAADAARTAAAQAPIAATARVFSATVTTAAADPEAAAAASAALRTSSAADSQAPDRGAQSDGAEPADPSPDASATLGDSAGRLASSLVSNSSDASRAMRPAKTAGIEDAAADRPHEAHAADSAADALGSSAPDAASASSHTSHGRGARAWLSWAVLLVGCAVAFSRCGARARAPRECCADLWEAAQDAAAGDPEDGSLLPLVGPGLPLHGRRAARPWRRLLALLARALTWQRAGKGVAADKRAESEGEHEGEDSVELAPLQRRGSTRRLGAERARWDSPQMLRALSLPSLSRMISEQWLPRLLDSTSDPPALVHGEALRALCREVLPRRYAIKDWRLVYSTEQHGCSLHTAYARVAEAGDRPVLLLVLDSAGAVFGAYSSVPPRADDHYRGSGESCLFRVAPHFDVYRWSNANDLFVLGGRDGLAFGSGPAFGLRVDDAFEFGSSGRSETFANECLASASEFRIVRAEIWGFV